MILMTAHTLNKFELARILGARALQLSFGAPPLMEVAAGQTSIGVAKAELEAARKALIQEQMVSQGLKEELQEAAKLKEVSGTGKNPKK